MEYVCTVVAGAVHLQAVPYQKSQVRNCINILARNSHITSVSHFQFITCGGEMNNSSYLLSEACVDFNESALSLSVGSRVQKKTLKCLQSSCHLIPFQFFRLPGFMLGSKVSDMNKP